MCHCQKGALLLFDSSELIERNDHLSSALDNIDHQLAFHKRKLESKDLSTERLIFSRLMYRNKCQHRSSDPYRKLIRVQQILKRIQKINFEGFLADLLNKMGYHKRSNVPWEAIPHPKWIHNGLIKSLNTMTLIDVLDKESQKAYKSLRLQTGELWFMSLNLLFMSCISKLRILYLEKSKLFVPLNALLSKMVQVMDKSVGCASCISTKEFVDESVNVPEPTTRMVTTNISDDFWKEIESVNEPIEKDHRTPKKKRIVKTHTEDEIDDIFNGLF
jgi:hypothetical protein